jgi:hypothetical protein
MDDLVPAVVTVGSSLWVGVTWPPYRAGSEQILDGRELPALIVDDAVFRPEWVA